MPIQDADIADIFNWVANLLEIADANRFRVRSYRNAARTVSSLSRAFADMVAGSFRRRKETVGDLDILVSCTRGSDVMDRFTGYEDIQSVSRRREEGRKSETCPAMPTPGARPAAGRRCGAPGPPAPGPWISKTGSAGAGSPSRVGGTGRECAPAGTAESGRSAFPDHFPERRLVYHLRTR